MLSEAQFNHLLNNYVPKLGVQQLTRIREAAAIAFYPQQTDCPVVQTLCCDDAPQFKLITAERALCWVHEGRHYKKLSPVFACHQVILGQFIKNFLDYYRKLLAYKDAPSAESTRFLKSKVRLLFEAKSGYKLLEKRQQFTAAKISKLLIVLEHPELPLHNNPAELAVRTMVQRRNISYATQTIEGTVLRQGILLCLLLLLLVSWGSVFSSMSVTEFLNLESFPLYPLLFAKNLLFIPWACLGN